MKTNSHFVHPCSACKNAIAVVGFSVLTLSTITSVSHAACVPLSSSQITPIQNLGSRWNQSAYNSWSKMLDGDLLRTDVAPQSSDVVRSMEMPFLVDPKTNGCATIEARVQMPAQHAGHVIVEPTSVPFQCPIPYTDSTPIVAQQLANLAKSAVSGQTTLELNFKSGCTYYFFSQSKAGANAHIMIPDVSDLTINGGSSLADAAKLIFVNPVAGSPVAADDLLQIAPATASGTGAFQDAFGISSGKRIAFKNLIIGFETPLIDSQTQKVLWGHDVPYVDFGSVSVDAKGHQIVTVKPNNANATYFNPYIRIISQTSVANPMDLDPTQQNAEADLSLEIRNFIKDASGYLTFDLTEAAGGKKFPKLRAAPVKIFHQAGLSSGLAFRIVQKKGSQIDDVSLTSIQIFAGPTMGMLAIMNRGLLLANMNITPLNPSSAHGTTAADGIHVASLVSDLIIENSTFQYEGDDAINVLSATSQLANITSRDNGDGTKTLEMELEVGSNGAFNSLLPQNPICVVSSLYEPLVCAPILSTSSVGGRNFILMTVPIGTPALQAGDLWFRMDHPASRVVIHKNTFTGNRARAIIFKGSNALIGQNRVTDIPGGIRVMPEAGVYTEGPMPRNIIIRNNQFASVGNALSFGAIGTGVSTAGTPLVTNQMLRHILISLNSGSALLSPIVVTSAMAESLVENNSEQGSNLSLYAASGSWWSNPLVNMGEPLGPVCALP